MRKKTLDELNRLRPGETHLRPTVPCVLVLDNIRSGLNVGSVFRTADALAVEKIWLCGITAHPPHREILKTAIGATETVEWSYEESTTDVLRMMKEEGRRIIGLEQTTESRMLQDVHIDPKDSYALVFGNEVDGLSEETIPFLNEAWEIPQFGAKHSFNISVSVGITLWHFLGPHIDALLQDETAG